VGSAFRADRSAAEGAVLDPADNWMVAMAVIERAHDLKILLTADRAGGLVDDKIAVVTLIAPLRLRDLFQ